MTVAVYRLTATFPREETYGLSSQLRRASVSVASNIAEGYGRNTRGEYKQFVGIARGSNCEIETHFVIARQLGFGDVRILELAESLNKENGEMLRALLDSL